MEPDTSNDSSNGTLVAAIDFSELSELTLTHAFEMADRMALVPHVLHVASASGPDVLVDLPGGARTVSSEKALEHLVTYVQDKLDKNQQTRNGPAGFGVTLCHLRLGAPAEEVAQFASDIDAKLIVAGTHGRTGAKRLFLGSVAEHIVRYASCPVMVVHSKKDSDDAKVPVLAPPCPECVATRQRTDGKEMWCETHKARMRGRHTYHYVPRIAAARANHPLLFNMNRTNY